MLNGHFIRCQREIRHYNTGSLCDLLIACFSDKGSEIARTIGKIF
jgi:hypothetical protein